MTEEYWKQAVIEGLDELSNQEFQEWVWLRHEGSEISSPGESVCELFDDTGLGDLMEIGGVFSDKADQLLEDLQRSLKRINLYQPIEKLLSSREWIDIRELALQALQEVKKVVNSK
jgi:hypothetical protein